VSEIDDRLDKRKRWITAAAALADDLTARIECPEHQDGLLTATFIPWETGGGGDILIECPRCKASISVRRPQGPPGAPTSR
jgi:hypothetical protein